MAICKAHVGQLLWNILWRYQTMAATRLRGGVKLWAKGYDPPAPWPGLLFRVGARHGLSGISPRVGDSRHVISCNPKLKNSSKLKAIVVKSWSQGVAIGHQLDGFRMVLGFRRVIYRNHPLAAHMSWGCWMDTSLDPRSLAATAKWTWSCSSP